MRLPKAVAALASTFAACAPPPTEAAGRLALTLRDDGRIDLADDAGRAFLVRARAEVLIDAGGETRSLATADCPGGWSLAGALPGEAPYFAATRGWRFDCATLGVGLTWRLWLDAAHDTALAQIEAKNLGASEITALRLSPVVAEAADAALFVGADPLRHRILDDGQAMAQDAEVELHFADERRLPLIDTFLSTALRGEVVANWNHAIVDLDSGASWIAGALSVERAFPLFGTTHAPGDDPIASDGRVGFDAFYADLPLAFAGKPLAAGESVASEVVYLDPLAPDAWTGLEDYADAVAAWNGVVPWTERDGGRHVPNGWNSWTGSKGSGGLGTVIDEQVVGENLAVMGREFAPFGVEWFQIDDGYQVADGDWFAREDRFPSGMEAMSGRIQARGLLPGIWISAFRINLDSTLAADHPDWIAREEDAVFGGIITPGAGQAMLDLSHEGVLAWLGATMRRYRDEWRERWLKLDFAYLALPYRPRANPRLTAMEAYVGGLRAIDEALGDDVFYLGVGLVGANFGVVDGFRLTLDAGPRWEQDEPFALLGSGGSFKSTVKTGARRYYFGNRLWASHDDLLFFRTDVERPDPPVTFDEALTFASFVGLAGSIVKFGEDLRTLTPAQIDAWRKLLPVYPAAGRPLDLFTRHYPEVWALPVRGTLAGSGAAWTVLGLLNWGRNYDFSVEPVDEIPDEARDYAIDLADFGLDPDRNYLAQEFWTETFLGVVRGRIDRTVAAHGHEVIALREATGRPQFLGHNRHLTQGGTDLSDETWDEASRTLRLAFDLDAAPPGAVPFEYRFRVYVPEGTMLADADVGDGKVAQAGRVLTVTLALAAAGPYEMRLAFAAK